MCYIAKVMLRFEKKTILGVPIASLTIQEIPKIILLWMKEDGKLTFFYVNAHCLVLASQNPEYKNILKQATLVYSGGIGPILASKILGKPLKERTPTPDFINSIFEHLQNENSSVYLIGSTSDSIKKAVTIIRKKFPKLKIDGYHSGFFSPSEETIVIKQINKLKPSVILVGMGSPSQEYWISKNKEHLNAKVFWAVGAMFDVISGKLPRAPKWIQSLRMEWLYRLFQEPKRLWKRYTFGILQFILMVIKDFYRR